MKKLAILLSILAMTASAVMLTACHEHTFSDEWSSDKNQHWHQATCNHDEKQNVADHAWTKTGETDVNGNEQYVCSVCDYAHEHTFDASKWVGNGRGHWRPATCGHDDATAQYSEHVLSGTSMTCSVCGINVSEVASYEVRFAYYVLNDLGQVVTDSMGSATEVGVTYTSLTDGGSVSIDTLNGAKMYEGDKISFTVKKSVYCEYTSGTAPELVVYRGKGDKITMETNLVPDANGVYTIEITSDTIISVANVRTRASQITGNGTQQSPYIINTVTDWLYFSNYVNDKYSHGIEYNTAYWQLNSDLDFEGETIYVIGDYVAYESSVFCGNFNGNGHTLSNFVLDNTVSMAQGMSEYVGVFGVASGYEGVDALICNLNVKDFTINGTAAEDSIVAAGGIVGFGAGVNIRNCTVDNCTINISADETYMSFAGGIVGFLQSALTENGTVFYASVSYSGVTNTTISGSGMLYDAGGIAGRLVSYSEQVTSFIYNSYSDVNISGAVRAGGIVGELQRYSSVQNSYSTATLSANTDFTDGVIEKYQGTVLDDRYSYAGGIAGYAENDTVIGGNFFRGSAIATAAAGKSFAKSDSIVAGKSAAGYADFYAEQAVVNANADDTVAITESYLKDTLKWSDADWIFGEGYPTVNQTENTHDFTISVSVDGEIADTFDVHSLYIPMSYWYILGEYNGDPEGIDLYVRNKNNDNEVTYGYYFDEALTKRVPAGYVPMSDITLYAEYADVSAIVGDYFLSGNGKSAKLTVNTDGTFVYEEGAVLLDGKYEYNGEYVTFKNAFFSRIAPTATATQQEYYYTFWAELAANGNLEIYDCSEQYVVTAEEEQQNMTFTAMARFFAKDDALVAITQENILVSGSFYCVDGTTKSVFSFNSDASGEFRQISATGSTYSDFTYEAFEQNLIEITLTQNGRTYVGTLENGKLVSITDPRDNEFAALEFDEFAGSWETSAAYNKVYEFDGMGGWTYKQYVYVSYFYSAVQEVIDSDEGSYVVENGVLAFTKTDGTEVTATISNGVVKISEAEKPNEIEFNALNGYRGEWYTAGNKIVRFSLSLSGLDQNGVGTARVSSTGMGVDEFRYTAVSSTQLYLYSRDSVYADLTYDTENGTIVGLFFDSETGSLSLEETFYRYDDYKGDWVSDIDGLGKLTFNGLGYYDVTDNTGNTLAVKGTVTIDGASVKYLIDRETEIASFTYNNVTYSLVYDEYSDSIAVSYGNENGVIARADKFAGVTMIAGSTPFVFDGRGNFPTGGTVIVDEFVECNYKIDEDGKIIVTGGVDAVISPVIEGGKVVGYICGGTTPCRFDNTFSGVWIEPNKNTVIEIGALPYLPEAGESVTLDGKYNGAAISVIYTGESFVSFTYDGTEYFVSQVLEGKQPVLILSNSKELGSAGESMIVLDDGFYGVWTDKSGNTLTFNGCGDSAYASGSVKSSDGTTYTYKLVNGVVTLYQGNSVYATFVECEATDGAAYSNGSEHYKLVK